MTKYKIEIGSIRKEWRGWDGYDEFFEADEWGELESEKDYNEEVNKQLKKEGLKVDDNLILWLVRDYC